MRIFLFVMLIFCTFATPYHGFAQSENEDSFDPFADYSEFDEASDEEADINFFRNGRLFTAGITLGQRSFTSNMQSIYSTGSNLGVYLSYFFDFNLALAMGYTTSDHSVKIITTTPQTYTGNMALGELSFDMKYFLNSQNLIKGLANLNPYLVIGLSKLSRTYTLTDVEASISDSASAFDFGAGIELPLLRKKSYIGIQATYHSVSFADETKAYFNDGTEKMTKTISGDPFDIKFILGLNF